MAYEQLHSETIFRGRVFEIQLDRVRLPDGKEMKMDLVIHRPAVTMIPVDEDGVIWFVRQYRYAVGKELLELPAGVLEEGEAAEEGAGRELREEIGMAAGELTRLGGFYLAPGYSSEYLHIYLARQLTPDRLPGDEDERIEVVKLRPEEVFAMIERGEIDDGKTLAALVMARGYFGQ